MADRDTLQPKQTGIPYRGSTSSCPRSRGISTAHPGTFIGKVHERIFIKKLIAKADKALSFSDGFREARQQIKASRSTTTSLDFEYQYVVFTAK